MNETMTNEMMTLEEIEERFDDEWVLVEDPEFDHNNEVVRGKVLFHSKNRDEMYAKAMELRPKRSASLYTGPVPDEIFINL
jgi:hypothetical protein